ncbi:CCA tRNA nucleotidyltransferase [Cochlodiniinecator piscidefendens]|uniref:CCA tRNA nucleotidyltransferase n=1 Tax=Cochlodiniinecator piscidefendens TaxID=2715756 RepID=UPI00140D7A93|nr:CCA tRNA nucleotidyltransferase [Cochlodiniinecator piscidefendens]
MTVIGGDWISEPATQQVMKMLTDAGYQAYFVGGCVRNELLNAPVADIDISTDATPDMVSNLAIDAGLKSIPTGIEHGTITVVSDSIPHEITTFRKDVETDGRRAVVSFSTDIQDDALRRDFTMNALYADANGQVLDPLGGLPDLRARQFRFIEDADRRIKEDYLRILRFFRFHAWYGDPSAGLDEEALAASAQNLDGIGQLSKERVGAEMKKLLLASDPAPAVAVMEQTGVLAQVIEGASAKALPVLVHFENILCLDPDPIRRLAVLGGCNHLEMLRLSRDEAKRLDLFRIWIENMGSISEAAYRHGTEFALGLTGLRAALFETPPGEGVAMEIQRASKAKFPIRADDLMPNFRGPALGAELRRLEKAWILSDFSLTQADLLSFPSAE